MGAKNCFFVVEKSIPGEKNVFLGSKRPFFRHAGEQKSLLRGRKSRIWGLGSRLRQKDPVLRLKTSSLGPFRRAKPRFWRVKNNLGAENKCLGMKNFVVTQKKKILRPQRGLDNPFWGKKQHFASKRTVSGQKRAIAAETSVPRGRRRAPGAQRCRCSAASLHFGLETSILGTGIPHPSAKDAVRAGGKRCLSSLRSPPGAAKTDPSPDKVAARGEKPPF